MRVMGRFLRESVRIVLPLVLVLGAVSLSLSLLNRLPSYIQENRADGVRVYNTVDEAERDLGVRIWIPAYFPDYLHWPPVEIKAKRRPVLTISLLFRSRQGADPVLFIHEILSEPGELPADAREPGPVVNRYKIDIGDGQGSLTLSKDKEGRNWSYLSWEKGGRYLVGLTVHSPEELLKIARSIRP